MTHILMTYPSVIPSVLLCGQFQLDELEKSGKIEFRSIRRDKLTSEDCGWADSVFLVRSDSNIEVEIANKCKRAGKLIVYVMDDDLLHVPEYSYSGTYYAQHHVKKNIQKLLDICDVFLSPSEELRKRYGGNKAAPIEEPSPNHLDKVTRPSQQIRIGFAGSVDRTEDFDSLLGRVIETLLDLYGQRIAVEFFGAQPKVAVDRRLKHIPYCDDYESYQQTMKELCWDIGLAPMPESQFHSGKHYNKYLEYSSLGIAGVYSDTIPYNRVVHDGENGLLCRNTEEAWIDALCRLIDDTALRKKIARNAQWQAKNKFSAKATALALEHSIGEVLTFESSDHSPIWISPLSRAKTQIFRFLFAIRNHCFFAPAVAVRKLKEQKKKKKKV